jgi:hypothetical protein
MLAAWRGDQPRQVSAAEYRNHLVTTFGDMKLISNPTDGAAVRDLAGEIRDAARAQGRLVAGLEEYAGQLDSLAVQFQLAQTGVPGRGWAAAFNELAARAPRPGRPAEPACIFRRRARPRTRTENLFITSEALCQLS